MSSIRRHPVFMVIRHAAYHGGRALPSDHDLDALKLSPEQRRSVARACAEAAAIHDTGAHGDAWQAGDEAAAQIIGSLPEKQQDPGYLGRGPSKADNLTDPADLAALVPRMY